MSDRLRTLGIALFAAAVCAGLAAFFAITYRAPTEPRDARGWVLEARSKMQLNLYKEAARAYEKGIAASPLVASDPQVVCEFADALAMAQAGKFAGRPAELVQEALKLNPSHPRALEMAGSVAYEAGDYALALRHWERLLAQLEPGSGAHADLSAAIARTRTML